MANLRNFGLQAPIPGPQVHRILLFRRHRLVPVVRRAILPSSLRHQYGIESNFGSGTCGRFQSLLGRRQDWVWTDCRLPWAHQLFDFGLVLERHQSPRDLARVH